MGAKLAKRILNEYPDHHIDVVIPIPGEKRWCYYLSARHSLLFLTMSHLIVLYQYKVW